MTGEREGDAGRREKNKTKNNKITASLKSISQ
jgi:hypothetical protein